MLTKHPRNRIATTEDEPGDLPGGLLVQARKDMAVGVHRDRDVGMAKALAHHLAG